MVFAPRSLTAVLLALCCILLLGTPSVVRAQSVGSTEQSARDAFEAGRIAYDHGRFAEALGHFELAYELNRHPKLLFNVARAAEQEGRSTRAIEAYERYLRAIPDAENKDFVQARLGKLRAGQHGEASEAAAPFVAPPAAPSARETAARAVELEGASTTAGAPRDDRSERKLYKNGWLWGAVGVVVAGAVTTAILLTRSPRDDGPETDLSIRTLEAR